MISRDLVLTITDKGVSLDKAVTLYRFDRGITLNIRLESDTYDLKEEITKARAIVLRPNKKLSATEITDIVDGVYVLYLDNTWTDHLGEVGAYQVQLQLYSDNPDDECITIAPFSFEVKNPIGVPTDSRAYVNMATVNNYSTGDSTDVPVGDLENGKYLKTAWIGGDLITAGKLNKVETAIDYLVTDSVSYVAKEDMPEIPTNVSELNNDAGYLTEHQSLEGLASEQYVTDTINQLGEAINTALESGEFFANSQLCYNKEAVLFENLQVTEMQTEIDSAGFITGDNVSYVLTLHMGGESQSVTGQVVTQDGISIVVFMEGAIQIYIGFSVSDTGETITDPSKAVLIFYGLEITEGMSLGVSLSVHGPQPYVTQDILNNDLNNAIGDINAILDNINGEEI